MKGLHLLFLIGLLGASACVEETVDFDSLRVRNEYSLEIANDVDIIYSDSAIMRVRVQGPVLKRFLYKFKIDEEFTDGVSVEFYDDQERPIAWMDAKYALRKQNEKLVIARDSVVLKNNIGESLETSELHWDEREETLTSDRFVRITRPPNDTIYSRGFKSNQDFTEYELYLVEGDLAVENFSSSYKKKGE